MKLTLRCFLCLCVAYMGLTGCTSNGNDEPETPDNTNTAPADSVGAPNPNIKLFVEHIDENGVVTDPLYAVSVPSMLGIRVFKTGWGCCDWQTRFLGENEVIIPQGYIAVPREYYKWEDYFSSPESDDAVGSVLPEGDMTTSGGIMIEIDNSNLSRWYLGLPKEVRGTCKPVIPIELTSTKGTVVPESGQFLYALDMQPMKIGFEYPNNTILDVNLNTGNPHAEIGVTSRHMSDFLFKEPVQILVGNRAAIQWFNDESPEKQLMAVANKVDNTPTYSAPATIDLNGQTWFSVTFNKDIILKRYSIEELQQNNIVLSLVLWNRASTLSCFTDIDGNIVSDETNSLLREYVQWNDDNNIIFLRLTYN